MITKLLVGRGYGVTDETKMIKRSDKWSKSDVESWVTEDIKDIVGEENTVIPEGSRSVYEVIIADVRDIRCANNDLAGTSWAWKFYDIALDKLPNLKVELSCCSPTLHLANDLTYEDTFDLPCTDIQSNDKVTMMGLRVKLHGLKGDQYLNGKIGRCAQWMKEKERYRVYLRCTGKSSTACKGKVYLVKPSNLVLVKPWDGSLHDSIRT